MSTLMMRGMTTISLEKTMDRLEKHVGELARQLNTVELSRLWEKSEREQHDEE